MNTSKVAVMVLGAWATNVNKQPFMATPLN